MRSHSGTFRQRGRHHVRGPEARGGKDLCQPLPPDQGSPPVPASPAGRTWSHRQPRASSEEPPGLGTANPAGVFLRDSHEKNGSGLLAGRSRRESEEPALSGRL